MKRCSALSDVHADAFGGCCAISCPQQGFELHHWLSLQAKLWQRQPFNSIHLVAVKVRTVSVCNMFDFEDGALVSFNVLI